MPNEYPDGDMKISSDRGVHASSQCCAMKLNFPLDKRDIFMDQVNSFLPADLRLHCITKVTKGFNSKLHCTKRRYDYMLPTYVLQENSEIGDILLNMHKKFHSKKAEKEYIFSGTGLDFDKYPEARDQLSEVVKTFRVLPEKLDLLRRTLHMYEGTRNYHNFTSGKAFSDADSNRYIISFDATEPFVDTHSGTQWIRLSVLGQSFLLNQIRKMVAVAVDITRGRAETDFLHKAFSESRVSFCHTAYASYLPP